MFDTVVIIGPGLIGGSLGMALRKRGMARHVVGVGHRRESLEAAVQAGALDDFTLDLAAAAPDADMVVLATSVALIPQQAATLIPLLKPGAVMTDAGSVKGSICRSIAHSLEQHTPGPCFVGAHPMAGSERRGVAAARADLFDGAMCILTPTRCTDPEGAALTVVRRLWEGVGCRVCEMAPDHHDRLLAQISHLPHVVAACMVNCVSEESLQFAARGFLDTTRIASGDPALWRDICMANREALAEGLRTMAGEAAAMADALDAGRAEAVETLLARAKTRRDGRLQQGGE